MKTRAAVAWEAGKPLEIEEIEIPFEKELSQLSSLDNMDLEEEERKEEVLPLSRLSFLVCCVVLK